MAASVLTDVETQSPIAHHPDGAQSSYTAGSKEDMSAERTPGIIQVKCYE